jgi:hypothetical protein
MLLAKQMGAENEMRGALRAFGLKLAGRITQATLEERAFQLVENRPRLTAMLRPMLVARKVLREQAAVLHKMLLAAGEPARRAGGPMTVPGGGTLTSVTHVTATDGPARFQRSPDRFQRSKD